MSRGQLLQELKLLGSDFRHTHRAVLVAKVFEILLQNFNSSSIDPMCMDDGQPEKWYLLAEQTYAKACEVEPDPAVRVSVMTESNKLLSANRTSKESLIEIAEGKLAGVGHSELFVLCAQYGACLMLEPEIEAEAEALTGNTGSIGGSVAMMSILAGYTGLRCEQTVVGALELVEKEQQKLPRKRNRKIPIAEDSDASKPSLRVEIGE